jgi:predicted Rossmann fold flavoprotein
VKFDGAVVIGAGPAGLWAAESLGHAGITTWIFDHKPSLGRKFLVAGRGGLNITHSEEIDLFASRYDNPKRWLEMLQRFPPQRLKAWFEELGVATYVGTSGRVFPRSTRAPEILERWLERLYELGCDIRLGCKFHQLSNQGDSLEIVFQKGQELTQINPSAVVFALGGASWPQTGSDGHWTQQ